ncbi:MAG: hypothetical protein ACYDH1_10135 [Anaerolineaceae bacterium]|jgi:hypothetical protein|nr:MAG: hypothetical protein CVU46_00415 [Chloroflexi bacterium HGW-Chloroflexi-8]
MDSDQNNDMTVPAPQEPLNPDAFQPQSNQLIDVPNYSSSPVQNEPVVQQEVPSYSSAPIQGEPVLNQEVPSYRASEYNPPPAKKDNKKIWIIVLIVLAVLCCCCIVIGVLTYRAVGSLNPQDWQDMLDQYGRIIQLAPTFM